VKQKAVIHRFFEKRVRPGSKCPMLRRLGTVCANHNHRRRGQAGRGMNFLHHDKTILLGKVQIQNNGEWSLRVCDRDCGNSILSQRYLIVVCSQTQFQGARQVLVILYD
jgi:hypothetical protein